MKHQRLPHKACGCGLAVVPSRLDFHQRNCSSAGSSQDLGYDMSPEAFLPTARDFIQTHADQRHTFQLSICQILSSCMELYRQQATAAVAKCEAMLATLIESAKMGSRLDNPAREYLRVIKDHTVGTPITSSQYHKGLWSVPSDNFVICSSDDAEKILMQGAPLLPILILPSLNKAANNHLAIEPYLKLLQTRPTLDIHDYDVEIYDGRFEAVALNSMSAVTRFLDATKGPVNFLNLSGHKQNAMPSCLERLDEYHIMETIRSQNGKRGEKIVCDLTESTRFQLLASKGAFHLPHVDRHGVITTVFNDEGEKLWLVWPFENTTDWSRSHSCLSGRVLALYLEEGSTLIQPSGMIHAPFTLENTLMTGTMHWHPQTMLQVLEQTQAEIQAPYITNEPVSEEFLIKVELILQRWNEEAGLVRWGTKEDLEKCRKLMEVRNSTFLGDILLIYLVVSRSLPLQAGLWPGL